MSSHRQKKACIPAKWKKEGVDTREGNVLSSLLQRTYLEATQLPSGQEGIDCPKTTGKQAHRLV